ncbi:MAG: biopolymer transporter ExbD [Pirellulales bacterium]|nr:biopolymer transporter ExbD [Pirellulales bacterium]
MADETTTDEALMEEDERPAIARRPIRDTADLDITPMIDITFLLLIFFLVASTADVQSSVDLPPARHGRGISERTSVILTIAERGSPGSALVYLGDGTSGTPLPDDPDVQEEQIARAVQKGFNEGRSTVLVKAEKGVLHREVSRVAAAAGQVEGIHLHMAVFEID